MTMAPFIESDITFGSFPDGHCFRVELSDTYRAIQAHVRIAEFLLLRPRIVGPPIIWIIEANQSSPRPETQPNFDEFIGEIRDKLANALAFGVASILKRHPAVGTGLPAPFQALNLAATEFRLVLVINGHQKAWLPPLQDALRGALRATAQTWALGPNSVVVINHEGAKRFGLISAP